MKAMILNGVSNLKENRNPLTMVNIPVPVPKDMEVLIKISVCGVCHTELDEIEGRIAPIVFPVVPGHQVVGIVTELGTGTSKFKIGDRVGVAWIYSACGLCKFCLDGKENLCDHFLATGKDVNGGYAEYMAVPEKYAHKIPEFFSDAEAAPLLCAGAIGYRSLRLRICQKGGGTDFCKGIGGGMGRRYLKCLPGEIGCYYRHHACLETRGGSSCQFKKRRQVGHQCHSKGRDG